MSRSKQQYAPFLDLTDMRQRIRVIIHDITPYKGNDEAQMPVLEEKPRPRREGRRPRPALRALHNSPAADTHHRSEAMSSCSEAHHRPSSPETPVVPSLALVDTPSPLGLFLPRLGVGMAGERGSELYEQMGGAASSSMAGVGVAWSRGGVTCARRGGSHRPASGRGHGEAFLVRRTIACDTGSGRPQQGVFSWGRLPRPPLSPAPTIYLPVGRSERPCTSPLTTLEFPS